MPSIPIFETPLSSDIREDSDPYRSGVVTRIIENRNAVEVITLNTFIFYHSPFASFTIFTVIFFLYFPRKPAAEIKIMMTP